MQTHMPKHFLRQAKKNMYDVSWKVSRTIKLTSNNWINHVISESVRLVKFYFKL